MTSIIWKKAKLLYNSSLIMKDGQGNKGEYYKVQDYESKKWHGITIETNLYGTTFTCTCTDQSLPHTANFIKGKQPLCSHIIAVIYNKYFETKTK